jgi:transposase InsO family protein
MAALSTAIIGRQPPAGLLYHSDRGVQYACGDFQALLGEFSMKCSMSRKGDCWDNAVVESFFASLKRELIDRRSRKSREDARAAVFDYIDVWYNRQRRHSTLGPELTVGRGLTSGRPHAIRRRARGRQRRERPLDRRGRALSRVGMRGYP